ncbi:MAG: hypothetical protein GY810_28370 [Aureispira sp.]|nr:hypothetical protein [Aureispira sp.]
MAIRNDFIVDWDASPRIITVAAPSVNATIQDIHDTCRFLEAEATAMHNPPLIDTAGLESLGGTDSVGLTSTLKNALIAFEARTGSAYIQCIINGGNLVAVDSDGNALPTAIYPTAFTQVVTAASSSPTISYVDTGSTLTAEDVRIEIDDNSTKLESIETTLSTLPANVLDEACQ